MVDDTLAICRSSVNQHGVVLNFNRIDSECFAVCRPLQISQVLLNLIQNARDAVDGQLEKWIEISIHSRDSVYELRVADSGGRLEIDIDPLHPCFVIVNPHADASPV